MSTTMHCLLWLVIGLIIGYYVVSIGDNTWGRLLPRSNVLG